MTKIAIDMVNIWVSLFEIKGVEKKTSPFDMFIILVKFEVLQRIFEFGPKKES